MGRLIDADVLLKDIADYPYGYRGMIKDTIAKQPTVDLDEIIAAHEQIGYEKGSRDGYAEALTNKEKHGHWIFGETMGHSWMKCSECCVSQSGQTATFTYCPNCGAKMDKDEYGWEE